MTYEICVLDHTDRRLMVDAAECLAETFTGVDLGDVIMKEPLSEVVQISTDDHQEFVLGYLEAVAPHELTIIAKDRETGRVIGVLASEIYDPTLPPPVFEGNLAPMNPIINFLEALDADFRDLFEWKLGFPMKQNEMIHMFMVGVRAPSERMKIALEMQDMVMDLSKKRGFKAVFGETTNPRSLRMCERYGFYMPPDKQGNPLVRKYETDELFHVVPADFTKECNLIYFELDEAYSLR